MVFYAGGAGHCRTNPTSERVLNYWLAPVAYRLIEYSLYTEGLTPFALTSVQSDLYLAFPEYRLSNFYHHYHLRL